MNLLQTIRKLREELDRLLDSGWTPPRELREEAEMLFADLGEVLNLLDGKDFPGLEGPP